MGGVIALGMPTVFATMATGPVAHPSPIHEEPPRGLVSLSLSLSLSYQPYPHGRKGGGSTSSLDKFILAISSTNRDLVGILISSWLVLERCYRRMMPRVFWFLIFEACDGMNEVEMERVLVDSKRSFLDLHLMEEWVCCFIDWHHWNYFMV